MIIASIGIPSRECNLYRTVPKRKNAPYKSNNSTSLFFNFFRLQRALLVTKRSGRFFVDKAHLALNDGSMFGKEGEGFMRMNIACPRAILDRALNQLEKAYHEKFE